MTVFPVIMCGGAGTRLWPASRPSRPKQFLALVGDRSIFQETVLRVAGLAGAAMPIVVGNVSHEPQIAQQLAEIGVEARLILEPEGRDSGPAIAVAAQRIRQLEADGIAVIVASDHHIPDAGAFRQAVARAVRAAEQNLIVTLGVTPTEPSQAYGYIKPGQACGEHFRVEHFVEKPDAATAERYLAEGYLWNSGNFVARAAVLLSELETFAPEVVAATAACMGAGDMARLALPAAFAAAPRISIDYAVMDRTRRAAVLPVDFVWSDLGAWDAVWAVSPQDAEGNASRGEAVRIASRNTLTQSAGPVVTLVGVEDLAVIVEPDAVLVTRLGASQGVKTLVGEMAAAGRAEIDTPRAEEPGLQAALEGYRRWFTASALPLWWSLGADHANGGFHEALDAKGRPLAAPRRARVQARQAYVYATAARAGWAGPWPQASRHALDFLLENYLRPDGLLRTRVTAEGDPFDETAWVYDQAFGLLALAAAQALWPGRARWREQAQALRAALQALRHPRGGFREAGPEPFQANCHMHLLEAALAWQGVDAEGDWRALADEIVALAQRHFIVDGAVVEFFDERWAAKRDAHGLQVEPGHQFEWAWLLRRWQALGGTLPAGLVEGLLARGLAGIGPQGVAVNRLDEAGRIVDAAGRLWPQTEWARAALSLKDDEAVAGRALAALRRYTATEIPGLWIDVVDAAGRGVEAPAPASSLYHLMGVALAADAVLKAED